jgi:hypothetical protein
MTSAATREIVRSVHLAAQGTSQVAHNIDDVTKRAGETGSASSRVLSSARALSSERNKLKIEVARFLATVAQRRKCSRVQSGLGASTNTGARTLLKAFSAPAEPQPLSPAHAVQLPVIELSRVMANMSRILDMRILFT